MKNPYQVLGIDPNATDDEIKQAYRALARKYHPDRYQDSDLAEMAEEKMKEINAAYDEIQKIRAGGGSSNHAGYGQSTGGYTYSGSDSNIYIQVRRLINVRRMAEAEQILMNIPEIERGAEWNFLMGCVAVGRGFYTDAQHYFDTACGMDPNNAEYRQAQERLRNRSDQFGNGQTLGGSSCSVCDCCAGMACADCCCNVMGGGC